MYAVDEIDSLYVKIIEEIPILKSIEAHNLYCAE